eukprot:evm.model.NODE_28529_length_24012_cov_13.999084.2
MPLLVPLLLLEPGAGAGVEEEEEVEASTEGIEKADKAENEEGDEEREDDRGLPALVDASACNKASACKT